VSWDYSPLLPKKVPQSQEVQGEDYQGGWKSDIVMTRSTLFIDNGGYSIKALYLPAPRSSADAAAAHNPSPQVFVMPNCVGAAPHAGTGIMGDQLSRLPHYHGLVVRRPVDRGFIVDGGLQARIWEHILQHFAVAQEEDVDVWLTVPFGTPKAVAQLLWLLCTRSFHFGSVTFVSSSFLTLVHYHHGSIRPDAGLRSTSDVVAAARGMRKRTRHAGEARDASVGTNVIDRELTCEAGGTAIVVDVGFSGTTVVPYIDYLPVTSSSVRLDVGGKLLTNRLKEFLSFSQMNVMEDTWLMNVVRERCCGVALQPWRSLRSYAVLWKDKSRAEVEAVLRRQEHQRNSTLPPPTTQTDDARRARGPHREGTDVDVNTPVRFYLPTIPALMPLGVLEAELPLRLPKTTAVDSSALQHLLLCHERFLIPELLFTPGDVGLDQQGLVQAITEGVFQRGLLQHVVALLRPRLLQRVWAYGGVANTPGLRARLQRDIQSTSPTGREGVPGGVEAPPPLPPLLKSAVADPVTTDVRASEWVNQTEASKSSSKSSVVSAMALLPLAGAYHLLNADTTSASQQQQSTLMALRELVQRRSRVELRHPVTGRVTVETIQLALQQLL
jgi:actin-related protein 6